MRSYFVKTPSFVKFLFKNWIWSFSTKEKTLYLTFDDGPTPKITNWTLNLLKEYNAKATFFCVGENIAKHPKIHQNIINQNHAIGNHTNNHLNGFKTATSTYLENISDFEKSNSTNSALFRPPYGRMTLAQSIKIRKKGYKIIMWDVLSADFDANINSEECLENVIRNTKNGSIIVFHDSVKTQEKLFYVLPKILAYYAEKGFRFKAIS